MNKIKKFWSQSKTITKIIMITVIIIIIGSILALSPSFQEGFKKGINDASTITIHV